MPHIGNYTGGTAHQFEKLLKSPKSPSKTTVKGLASGKTSWYLEQSAVPEKRKRPGKSMKYVLCCPLLFAWLRCKATFPHSFTLVKHSAVTDNRSQEAWWCMICGRENLGPGRVFCIRSSLKENQQPAPAQHTKKQRAPFRRKQCS